jgi:hypothetical protein
LPQPMTRRVGPLLFAVFEIKISLTRIRRRGTSCSFHRTRRFARESRRS